MSEETATNQLPQQVISVLAVDDDHLFLHSCQRSLERACFTVHTANNSNDALSMATDHDYDIVLLDVNMLQMSGLFRLPQLKKEHSKTEVIIVTGEGDLETAVKAMKLGAADFLTKPLQTAALIEKIETLVAQSRALLENNTENNSERLHNERRREKTNVDKWNPIVARTNSAS